MISFFNPVNHVNLVKFIYGFYIYMFRVFHIRTVYSLALEPFAEVILQAVKKSRFFNFSPLSLCPFPPKGAREVVVPQLFPAPAGGRMSEGQEGGFIH
jgi:hypothetical protein